ncbi:MAG: PIG-L family deacetylase [Candidatus Dojkabacteria bacterium]
MFFLIFILSLIIGYIMILILLQDLHFPNLELKKFQVKDSESKTNVLFIFPHPDDEVMSSGGLLRKLVKDKNFNVFVVDVTKGDRGDEILKLSPEELGKVRESEFKIVMKIVGVKNGEVWDIPDGKVPENFEKLKRQVEEFIQKNNINLVVTYEKWGVYGHQDHVALSKVVHEISESNKDVKVLYSTIGPKVARSLNLKKYIKGLDLANFESNEPPEFKLFTLKEAFARFLAARQYKSQNLSHKYPLWVTILMNPYEYYTTKYE